MSAEALQTVNATIPQIEDALRAGKSVHNRMGAALNARTPAVARGGGGRESEPHSTATARKGREMTTTANGQVAVEAPRTAAEHVTEAGRLLAEARGFYPDSGEALALTAMAQVHATLAIALAEQRAPDAEDRIASCVPDGLDSLSVSVRGQR